VEGETSVPRPGKTRGPKGEMGSLGRNFVATGGTNKGKERKKGIKQIPKRGKGDLRGGEIKRCQKRSPACQKEEAFSYFKGKGGIKGGKRSPIGRRKRRERMFARAAEKRKERKEKGYSFLKGVLGERKRRRSCAQGRKKSAFRRREKMEGEKRLPSKRGGGAAGSP